LRRILLADAAVATSGDLWQYSIVDGQRQSHILDPKTGYGVPGPLAATVIASTALDADAMATVACILDWREIERLVAESKQSESKGLERASGLEVLVARSTGNRSTVNAEPEIHTTSGFPEEAHSEVELP
jgi:hypothetical protein